MRSALSRRCAAPAGWRSARPFGCHGSFSGAWTTAPAASPRSPRSPGLADRGAAPLEEEHVTPDAVELTEPLTATDDAEADALMEAHAGLVLREDPGLDRPDAGRLGRGDERLEQRPTDA